MSTDNTKPTKPMTVSEVLNKAAASALRGGVAGAAAMGANVATLMWLRTTVRKFCACVCVFVYARMCVV
jgi:hypothetical protein